MLGIAKTPLFNDPAAKVAGVRLALKIVAGRTTLYVPTLFHHGLLKRPLLFIGALEQMLENDFTF